MVTYRWSIGSNWSRQSLLSWLSGRSPCTRQAIWTLWSLEQKTKQNKKKQTNKKKNTGHSPVHPCFYSNRWVLFSITILTEMLGICFIYVGRYITGSCKMMFPISYLACLLMTTRTNQVEGYNSFWGFTIITLVLGFCPQSYWWLLAINTRLSCIIHYNEGTTFPLQLCYLKYACRLTCSPGSPLGPLNPAGPPRPCTREEQNVNSLDVISDLKLSSKGHQLTRGPGGPTGPWGPLAPASPWKVTFG